MLDVEDPSVTINILTGKLVKVFFVMPDGRKTPANVILEEAEKYLTNEANESKVVDILYSLGGLGGDRESFMMGYVVCKIASAKARAVDPSGDASIDISAEALTETKAALWKSQSLRKSAESKLKMSKMLADRYGGKYEGNTE